MSLLDTELENRITKLSEKNITDLDTVAKEVLDGEWGYGKERKDKLEAAGYDYNDIQSIVNEKALKYYSNKYETVDDLINGVRSGDFGPADSCVSNLLSAGYSSKIIDKILPFINAQEDNSTDQYFPIEKKKETKKDAVEMLLTVINLIESGQYRGEDCIIKINIKSAEATNINLEMKGSYRGFKGWLRRKGIIE